MEPAPDAPRLVQVEAASLSCISLGPSWPPRTAATLHQGEKGKDVPNSVLMLHSVLADLGANPNKEAFPEDGSMMFKVSN